MYNEIIFKLIGILGLVAVTDGVITASRQVQDVFYIFGGLCLLAYSLSIHDAVFSILQIIFTLAAVFDLLIKGTNVMSDEER